ncbi:MAG: hypothetical protein J6Q89_08420 [Clostridia bacterium]|nr:hypothetical protein [Clostridia bacterium]
MINFESKYSVKELMERWDEFTSPARFSGSDDTMDLIFVSKRNENKVKLIRRARSTRDPFSTVFRGKIIKTEKGSVISGVFTKSILDYITVALVLVILFYLRSVSETNLNALLVCSIIGGILLLYNTRASKRRFAEFICRIIDEENKYFLTKKEIQEQDEGYSK